MEVGRTASVVREQVAALGLVTDLNVQGPGTKEPGTYSRCGFGRRLIVEATNSWSSSGDLST